jgi:uncharacterized membrane protein YkoI
MLKQMQKLVMVVAAAAALAVGGAVIADAASKKDSTTSQPQQQQGRNGIPPQRSDETVLTDGTAQQVKDAALKKVPGATVLRVETDAEGSPYEAHLRKSDGSEVTAKVNKQFEVTKVEQGFGGGPGGRRGPGGPPGGASNNGTSYGAPAGPAISG